MRHFLSPLTLLGLLSFTWSAGAQTAPEATTEDEEVGATSAQLEDSSPAEVEPGSTPTPAPTPVDRRETESDEAAPSLAPLQITTSTWTRFEVREGYDRLGVSRGRFQEGDAFFYRARLGVRTAPLELTPGWEGFVQFTPQVTGVLGQTDTVTAPNLGVYEAYFKIQNETFSFEAGRFRMNYGDSLVIGDLDWSHTGRSFDGFRGRYSLEGGAYVDAFVTLTAPQGGGPAEGYPSINSPFLGGDFYFWGVYAGWGALIDPSLELDTYLLGMSNREGRSAAASGSEIGGATEFTLGARIKRAVENIDYRLEAGVQLGTRPIPVLFGGNQSVFAYQADGELGVTWEKKYRVALNGVIASGDNQDPGQSRGWHELFPTGHKFLGLMDVMGARTNIAQIAIKSQAQLNPSLRAALDAYLFSRLTEGGLGRSGSDQLAGYEIDAQLIQQLGRWGLVRGLYGLFIPHGNHYGTGSVAHYMEIQGGLQF